MRSRTSRLAKARRRGAVRRASRARRRPTERREEGAAGRRLGRADARSRAPNSPPSRAARRPLSAPAHRSFLPRAVDLKVGLREKSRVLEDRLRRMTRSEHRGGEQPNLRDAGRSLRRARGADRQAMRQALQELRYIPQIDLTQAAAAAAGQAEGSGDDQDADEDGADGKGRKKNKADRRSTSEAASDGEASEDAGRGAVSLGGVRRDRDEEARARLPAAKAVAPEGSEDAAEGATASSATPPDPLDVAMKTPAMREILERISVVHGASVAAETASRGAKSRRAIYDDRRAALAYGATRMPATYAAIKAALGEVRARGHFLQAQGGAADGVRFPAGGDGPPGDASPPASWVPKTLLDVGAGPGTATWAAQDTWPERPLRVTAVEPEKNMIWLGRELHASRERAVLARVEAREVEAGTRGRAARGAAAALDPDGSSDSSDSDSDLGERDASSAALPASPSIYWQPRLPRVTRGHDPWKHGKDLVVAAYVLGELPDARARARFVDELWRRTRGVLVLLEPGTPAGSRHVLEARSRVLETERDAQAALERWQEDLDPANWEVCEVDEPLEDEVASAGGRPAGAGPRENEERGHSSAASSILDRGCDVPAASALDRTHDGAAACSAPDAIDPDVAAAIEELRKRPPTYPGGGVVSRPGAHVLAPCPHDGPCPLDGRRSWCHFSQRFRRPTLQRRAKTRSRPGQGLGAIRSFQDERYSYVALARGPRPPPAPQPAVRPESLDENDGVFMTPEEAEAWNALQLQEAAGSLEDARTRSAGSSGSGFTSADATARESDSDDDLDAMLRHLAESDSLEALDPETRRLLLEHVVDDEDDAEELWSEISDGARSVHAGDEGAAGEAAASDGRDAAAPPDVSFEDLEGPEEERTAAAAAAGWSRILRDPQKKGGHVILDLCSAADGGRRGELLRQVVSKRAAKNAHGSGEGYRLARTANWGDLWPRPYQDALRTITPAPTAPVGGGEP